MMMVVILCGGRGFRMDGETDFRPKPMIAIGGKPILWHIMKHYVHHGYTSFVLCTGYKGEKIREYIFDIPGAWIEMIDTGEHTNTGGRLNRIKDVVRGPFMMTYGDGLSTVDLATVNSKFQSASKPRAVVLTAVRPKTSYGILDMTLNGIVTSFREKPTLEEWVNGGFMICHPSIFELIKGDDCILEKDVLPVLAERDEVLAHKHYGFWQCMDTRRDMVELNRVWAEGKAPWRTWME